MPLLPIDLQTMFSHMNQIGKEQALQKEISPLQQSLQGEEIAKDSKERDTTINETDEVGEGLEKIKDKEKKKESEQGSGQNKKEKQKENTEQKEFFKEPYLGQHIDITG
ncbi:MAG: hypothetical protein JXB88_06360 [Spirochaetales bacterium]|nr:hypothetical protein [Spirochaetales bacterium]